MDKEAMEAACERYPALRDALALCHERMSPEHHGDAPRWLGAIAALPDVVPSIIELGDTVRIGDRGDLDPAQSQALENSLRALHPWRKGPFEFFGTHIDTEWRSDWKWRRLDAVTVDLDGARVLDVGAGNGYYGWRMLGAGAEFVLGVDPTILFNMQHRAASSCMGELATRNVLLPLRFEELPQGPKFDLAFSMGVLYHRRDPHEHIARLRSHLTPGGRVVVETLVVDDEHAPWLSPGERYARMRNVWCVPTVETVQRWLNESGFEDPTVISVERTSIEEQRTTDWMRFESLVNALDPGDPTRTIEGHPAPVRAIVTARLGQLDGQCDGQR
jgi:tRNA (mo5U34)-methyltransferase